MNIETFLCQLLIGVIVKLFSILVDKRHDNEFLTIKFEPSLGEPQFHIGRGLWISVWIIMLLAVGLFYFLRQ